MKKTVIKYNWFLNNEWYNVQCHFFILMLSKLKIAYYLHIFISYDLLHHRSNKLITIVNGYFQRMLFLDYKSLTKLTYYNWTIYVCKLNQINPRGNEEKPKLKTNMLALTFSSLVILTYFIYTKLLLLISYTM